VVWIMSRVIAVTACGFMLAACSATMPSLSLDFMKSAPQPETLTIESQPPGAEAKTSLGQNCRTPCQFRIQPGSEFSVTLTLNGSKPQRVSVRRGADGAVAVPRLAPTPVHVELQGVVPPNKPVPKKKKPAEATGGDAAGRAPSPPAEKAPSATNYPSPARYFRLRLKLNNQPTKDCFGEPQGGISARLAILRAHRAQAHVLVVVL